MADENISIAVTDSVQPAIITKLQNIAKAATEGGNAVERLNQMLKGMNGGNGLSRLQSELNKLTVAANSNTTAQSRLAEAGAKAAVSQQRLATEVQKTQVQMANVEAALQRAVAAENLAAIAATKLAAEQSKASVQSQRLITAQNQTAESATRAQIAIVALTQAQTNAAIATQRLNTAAAQTAAAQMNANSAMTRSQTATQTLAAATVRVTTAQTQGATATARLATEQQRTATQTANAAAAADRAALAALRLAQAQNQVNSASRNGASSVAAWVKGLAVAGGGGFGAVEILKVADAYTVMQNKLQNVSTSQEQVNELQSRLYDLANNTRSAVDATTTSFTRFDRSLKGMGKSQEDTLRLTETINKALIVSGATSGEAASALLQLSQAFNAGKLQGDEFRAVSENMPLVLDAVANVMGVTTSQVKKLGTEGKITAKVMYDAFKSIETSIDATFAKTAPTLSQAMTVLGNSFGQYIGQINDSLGITKSMSLAIIELSKNMGVVGVVAGTVAVALAVAYGPSLIGLLAKARSAFVALSVAMAANPVGIVIVALAAATLAVMQFGDQVMLSSQRAVTLKDGFLTAFEYVKDGFRVAADSITNVWGIAVDVLVASTGGWAEEFRNAGDAIVKYGKLYANAFIATYVGAFAALKVVTDNFPEVVRYAFAQVVNFVSRAVSQIMNLWLDGLTLINKGLAQMAPNAAASIQDGLNSLRIELPQIDIGEAPKNAAAEVGKAFMGAFNKDYVGDAASAFMDRAAKLALQRRLAAGVRGKPSNLRGDGTDTTGNGDDGKAAEKRATALAKVNAQLDNELSRMLMLQPAREAQAKFDQIEETLIGKKIKLTEAETASIKAKIKSIQDNVVVQGAMDQIYNDAIAPQRDFNAQIKAAGMLLANASISQSAHDKAVTKATETYKNAVDPMRQFNKELQQQSALLDMNPKDRTVEQQVQQVQNQLLAQGTVLTKEQTDALRSNILAVQQKGERTAALDAIYQSTTGATDALRTTQDALNQSLASGTITQEYYTNQMAQTNIAMAELQNKLGNGDMFSIFTAGVGQALNGFTTLAQGAADIIGNVMNTTIDGISNAVATAVVKGDDLKASLASVGQAILTEMLGALIKLGVQYVINAALGTSTAAGQTAASVAMAGTVAAAWAPAAAAVSLASFGANAAPASFGVASTFAITKTLSTMGGFQKGGWTGTGAVDQIAGFVHGQEYVMPADAVRRIGVDNLDAMKDGASSVGTSVKMAGTSVAAGGDVKINFQVVNNNGSKVTQSQEKGENGEWNFTVMVDQMEEALANRTRDRSGPLYNGFKDSFNLSPNIGPV